jgi:hypothetical protein
MAAALEVSLEQSPSHCQRSFGLVNLLFDFGDVRGLGKRRRGLAQDQCRLLGALRDFNERNREVFGWARRLFGSRRFLCCCARRDG